MDSSPEPIFKLYRIDSDALRKPSFAICTAYRNPGGHLRAEAFLLLQNTGSDVEPHGKKITFPFGINQPFKMDESFAEEEAMRQAELDFAIHGQPPSSSNVDRPFKFEFVEIPPHRLFVLWSEDAYKSALARIAFATECYPLESYIDALRRIPPARSAPMDF